MDTALSSWLQGASWVVISQHRTIRMMPGHDRCLEGTIRVTGRGWNAGVWLSPGWEGGPVGDMASKQIPSKSQRLGWRSGSAGESMCKGPGVGKSLAESVSHREGRQGQLVGAALERPVQLARSGWGTLGGCQQVNGVAQCVRTPQLKVEGNLSGCPLRRREPVVDAGVEMSEN